MIALTNTPIVSWDDFPYKPGIIRVPYLDIDEIVEALKDEPAERPLLAPYRPNDPSFNARAASVLWDRFPTRSVLMPVAVSDRISLQGFVSAALKSGFRNIAVPYRYGHKNQYRFDTLMQFLHGIYDDSTWFHVAGGAPEIPDGWEGIWSWSEEEL